MAWGQTLEYIESLPESTLHEFQALNAISPFTSEAQAYREGLTATLLYNSNVSKKSDAKSITDLFPYLNPETPDWLEDARVLQAKDILNSITCHGDLGNDNYTANIEHVYGKIREEIEMETCKKSPDIYVIRKLEKLIGNPNG